MSTIGTLESIQRVADEHGSCHRKNVGALAVVHGTDIRVAFATNSLPVRCMDCRLICARARGESRLEDYSDCPSIHAEVNLLTNLSQIIGEAHLDGVGLVGVGGYSYPLFDVFISAPPCRDCMGRLMESKLIADISWLRVQGRDDHVVVDENLEYGYSLTEYSVGYMDVGGQQDQPMKGTE